MQRAAALARQSRPVDAEARALRRHGQAATRPHGTRLHSHAFNYGHAGGSGRQQVTAFAGYDDNDLWRIRSPGPDTEQRLGVPILHGYRVRLEHVATGCRLTTARGFVSPVTRQQEVSCATEGSGRTWRVEVQGGGSWDDRKQVRLTDPDSGVAPHSHAHFAHPRWTMGQQEVTGYQYRDDNDLWDVSEIRSDPPEPENPFGNLDSLGTLSGGGLTVRGWAIDPDTTASIAVHIYVGGRFAGEVMADRSRPDIASTWTRYGDRHGFEITVPGPTAQQTICAYGINMVAPGANALLSCDWFIWSHRHRGLGTTPCLTAGIMSTEASR